MNVSTIGLTRGEVLAALYNASKPQGMGMRHFGPAPMTAEQAEEILKGRCNFDYLNGRVMKVSIKGDDFDPRLYNRDNGDGAAQRAITEALAARK